jgi:hypothetical protein
MILVYLATPYSDPDPNVRTQRNYLACKKSVELISTGKYLVYSPIVSAHPLVVGWGLQIGFGAWEELDKRMIDACDEVHVYCIPGWKESVGVTAEIKYARAIEKPVVYHNP